MVVILNEVVMVMLVVGGGCGEGNCPQVVEEIQSLADQGQGGQGASQGAWGGEAVPEL